MKKFAIIAFALALLTTSCKKEEEVVIPEEETPLVVAGLQIEQDSTKVSWTGYKTSDKVAVTGTFQKVEITNFQNGTTPEMVLQGARFSIPVSSLFSDNADRDSKLKEIFFGTMKNTELISGIVNFENEKCLLTLTLNDVTKQIEIPYTYENKKFEMSTTIKIEDFSGESALAAIHKACFELHKGADGVSKTWDEFAIAGSVIFK